MRFKMVGVVPSLSTQGWLTTIGEKADRLLSYFFTSEYSQSKCFYGEIASLPYLLSRHQSKMGELRNSIETVLGRMMSQYFEKIEFDVRVEPDDESETAYTIYVSARILDKGETHQLGRIINVNDSRIVKISKLSQI